MIPRLDGNENVKNSNRFRASLHGPGWPRLPVFQGLALPLNPFTSYERAGWLGFRDLCFSNRDLGKLAKKFCHMCNSARFPGWTLAARIASSCIAGCIFHIITILFNCSDTAIRIAKAMKLSDFCVSPCLLAFSHFRQNSLPGYSALSHLGNRAEISHMNPRRKFVPR